MKIRTKEVSDLEGDNSNEGIRRLFQKQTEGFGELPASFKDDFFTALLHSIQLVQFSLMNAVWYLLYVITKKPTCLTQINVYTDVSRL